MVEVIAFVLKHIKSKLADELNKLTESTLKTSEMHWVITVPAIWTPDSKQMMREAAYMVWHYCHQHIDIVLWQKCKGMFAAHDQFKTQIVREATRQE